MRNFSIEKFHYRFLENHHIHIYIHTYIHITYTEPTNVLDLQNLDDFDVVYISAGVEYGIGDNGISEESSLTLKTYVENGGVVVLTEWFAYGAEGLLAKDSDGMCCVCMYEYYVLNFNEKRKLIIEIGLFFKKKICLHLPFITLLVRFYQILSLIDFAYK